MCGGVPAVLVFVLRALKTRTHIVGDQRSEEKLQQYVAPQIQDQGQLRPHHITPECAAAPVQHFSDIGAVLFNSAVTCCAVWILLLVHA